MRVLNREKVIWFIQMEVCILESIRIICLMVLEISNIPIRTNISDNFSRAKNTEKATTFSAKELYLVVVGNKTKKSKVN